VEKRKTDERINRVLGCFLEEWTTDETLAQPIWPLAVAEPLTGCTGNTTNISNSGELRNKIAVFFRGDCTFSAKVQGARTSGAVGVIIVNSAEGSMVRARDRLKQRGSLL
jgi:hypothetical protein